MINLSVDVENTDVTVHVRPDDKEMYYVSYFADKEYVDGFESDEAFFQDELDYYGSEAASWGISVEDYMRYILMFQGDRDLNWSIAIYDVPQYAYAYGVNYDDITLATRIFKVEFVVTSSN